MDQQGAGQKVRLAEGTEMSYRVSGPSDAPVLVMLHGLGESAASWDSEDGCGSRGGRPAPCTG